MPPKARGRKSRLLRPGETPDDRLLVIRATPANADGAADEIVEDAVLSARQYVIEATPGIREVLYGISVFARRPGVDIGVVVERFTGAAAYFEVAVGALRAVGFEIHPTGTNPDHYDIQLISGMHERDPEVPGNDVRRAATGVLGAGDPLQPNPAYIDETGESWQEDR